MALLEVRGLVKQFPQRGGVLRRVTALLQAVDGVDLEVERGETLGIVGESGCGKSTLARCVVRLLDADAGSIRYDGAELGELGPRELMPFRRRMQIVFQDPEASLNPRLTVAAALREVLSFHRVVPAAEVEAEIDRLLEQVGLRPDDRRRFPHEFSGGQRQRIALARSLAVRPELLVADEPVSALDVSVQAQILNLMSTLRERLGLSLVFISHDLDVVQSFCDRVMVMHLGRVVEELPAAELATRARHPYTRALLESRPTLDPDQRHPVLAVEGEPPSPYDPPPGCRFASRCPLHLDRCEREDPVLTAQGEGHRVACWAVEEDSPQGITEEGRA